MSDLISRQAAISAFLADLTRREEKNLLHTWSTVEVKYYISKVLEQLPTVEKHGHWIEDGYEDWYPTCSECGYMAITDHPYCPNCGARMDETCN